MWIFGRKGPSGFSACSTAEEVTLGIDGTGLTAIVTGASSGIGTETTRIFALHGIHVIMGVRNVEAGKKAKENILKENPDAKIQVMELDRSSMASVRKFPENYNYLGLPLNLLINNAGIMAVPHTLSTNNIELQFATNHLGHFLLTYLLLETMKSTARESHVEGRIVNISSGAHKMFTYKEEIRFDKINDKDGLISPTIRYTLKTVQQGAATTCYVALHPQVKGVSGEYFANSNISEMTSLAKDENLAKKLWDFSLTLTESTWKCSC